MRYAWDMKSQYLNQDKRGKGISGLLRRYLLYRLRFWDARSANGVDQFYAISQHISRRVRKTYRRESQVLYPPVDTESFVRSEQPRGDYYVTASRFVPHKLLI